MHINHFKIPLDFALFSPHDSFRYSPYISSLHISPSLQFFKHSVTAGPAPDFCLRCRNELVWIRLAASPSKETEQGPSSSISKEMVLSLLGCVRRRACPLEIAFRH
jgi:hypothetical protein